MKSNRRYFLKGTAVFAGAVFTFIQEMKGHTIASVLIEAQEKAEPMLFDQAETTTLAAMAAQIIPTTNQPGAAEVGVVIYLNSDARKSASRTQLYKSGLAELGKLADTKFGKPFASVTFNDQTKLLKEIEKGDFFAAVRTGTIQAYYTSPVGIFVASGHHGANRHGLCAPSEGFLDIDQKPKIGANWAEVQLPSTGD